MKNKKSMSHIRYLLLPLLCLSLFTSGCGGTYIALLHTGRDIARYTDWLDFEEPLLEATHEASGTEAWHKMILVPQKGGKLTLELPCPLEEHAFPEPCDRVENPETYTHRGHLTVTVLHGYLPEGESTNIYVDSDYYLYALEHPGLLEAKMEFMDCNPVDNQTIAHITYALEKDEEKYMMYSVIIREDREFWKVVYLCHDLDEQSCQQAEKSMASVAFEKGGGK